MEKNFFTVRDAAEAVNAVAPVELQEEWDNSGLQIGFGENPAERILTCLDVRGEVVQEAAEQGASLIVSHHPLIFEPLSSVNDGTYRDRLVIELIQNEISVYACHTPFDKVKGGNNDILARRLGLTSVKNLAGEDVKSPAAMIERKAPADMGRIGKLKKPLDFSQVIELVSRELQISLRQLHAVGELSAEIETVGICSGAGAEFLQMAREAGCDLFLTGDVKYHQAQEARSLGICLLDAGHYDTEKFFSAEMAQLLEKKLDEQAEVLVSRMDLDPFAIL